MTDQNSPGDDTETTRTPLRPARAVSDDRRPVASRSPARSSASEGRSIADARRDPGRIGHPSPRRGRGGDGRVAGTGHGCRTERSTWLDARPPRRRASPSGKVPRGPLSAFGLPFGGGPGFARRLGSGSAASVSVASRSPRVDGSNVSLKTDDGWTRTIAVTADTKITKGGATIKVGDLAVGDHVRIAQDRASDGTYTVTAIIVVLPSVAGQVSAIDWRHPHGHPAGRDDRDDPRHAAARPTRSTAAPGALSDIKVGSFIVAEGTQRADGSLDAAVVRSGFGGRGVPGGPGFGPSFPGGRHGQGAPKGSPAPSSGAS